MAKKLSITEAKDQIFRLPETLRRNQVAKVTRNGTPVLAVLRWEEYCGLVKTMEIMSDPELVMQIRRGIADVEAGRVIPWDEACKQLGWI